MMRDECCAHAPTQRDKIRLTPIARRDDRFDCIFRDHFKLCFSHTQIASRCLFSGMTASRNRDRLTLQHKVMILLKLGQAAGASTRSALGLAHAATKRKRRSMTAALPPKLENYLAFKALPYRPAVFACFCSQSSLRFFCIGA